MAIVVDKVIEKAFEAIYNGVEDLIRKNVTFKSSFIEFQSRLNKLKPLIFEMVELNKQLDCPEEELKGLKEVMKAGEELVNECKQVKQWWKVFKRFKYANKLVDWEKDVQDQLNLLPIHVARDGKKTRLAVEEMVMSMQDQSSSVLSSVRCALPELPELEVGMESPLEELKERPLRCGEVSMLVVTAPGGAGKTTLASKFCQDQEVIDKFKENIFFLTVSEKPNLVSMVQQLYQHKGSKINIQREAEADFLLHKFLNEEGQGPYLIVLDDVWSESVSLLDKFMLRKADHKILVTSRSVFPAFGASYNLSLLDKHNAMKLFHHSASLGDKSSHIPEHLSREVVQHCNGFPLVIKVVGTSLRGQPIEIWKKRMIDWSRGNSIFDDYETQLLLRLKSSLDGLKQEVKDCFLDLAAFPEDKNIPVPALIDIWSELYNDLDEESLCVANLYELSNRSLATLVDKRKEKVDGDVYYSEFVATQHDLLRQLALYMLKMDSEEKRKKLILNVSGDKIPKWWKEQKHQSMAARLLSISTDSQFSMNWPDMHLPEAEVLVLNFDATSANICVLPNFVQKMHNLKVLLVINYGAFPANLSNFELLGSLSKLKTIRLQNIYISPKTRNSMQSESVEIYIHSITRNPLQSESVEKLSLHRCIVAEAFSEGSFKISDAFPNLVELTMDYCVMEELPAGICDLRFLKKLCITHSLSYYAFSSTDNCSTRLGLHTDVRMLNFSTTEKSSDLGSITWLLEQKKSTTSLANSEVLLKLGNPTSSLEGKKALISLAEQIGVVNLEELRTRCFELLELPTSSLKKKKALISLPEQIGKLVNLEELRLRYCKELLELPTSIRKLKNLRFLDITGCSSMMELPAQFGEMSSLRKICMRDCRKVKDLPPSIAKLKQLEQVICDGFTKDLWEPFIPSLGDVLVVVAKRK